MLGGTHSHGTGHVASGVEDQVRDAVLILVAPIPERDLAGRQDSGEMLRALAVRRRLQGVLDIL